MELRQRRACHPEKTFLEAQFTISWVIDHVSTCWLIGTVCECWLGVFGIRCGPQFVLFMRKSGRFLGVFVVSLGPKFSRND